MLRIVLNAFASPRSSIRCISNEKPTPPKKTRVDIVKEKTPSGKLDDQKPYEDPYLKNIQVELIPKLARLVVQLDLNQPDMAIGSVRDVSQISD
ncbi:hypothetical protein KIN20_023011 [Parelaphostrongylus tenuis]|uniref:Uncharacterized protein n=1 Tax=Parelaphostrongylus tenuis TaxID=148309 RepID=A0AAD5N9P8_PARTN|nr:hypothetical protein KIN20_023011 [Parelaphostrongylus tenuis]